MNSQRVAVLEKLGAELYPQVVAERLPGQPLLQAVDRYTRLAEAFAAAGRPAEVVEAYRHLQHPEG